MKRKNEGVTPKQMKLSQMFKKYKFIETTVNCS